MKLLGYKINGYLVILGLIFVFMLSSATGCGCLKCGAKEAFSNIVGKACDSCVKNASNLYEAVHLNQKLRQNSIEIAKNDFIREHYIHNNNNYKNCPCSQKQLQILSTRGGNSQPVNVF